MFYLKQCNLQKHACCLYIATLYMYMATLSLTALQNTQVTSQHHPVRTRGLTRECVLRIPSVSKKATKWGGFSE